MNGLAVAQTAVGSLNLIKRLVRRAVYVAAVPEFGEHAAVANGASEVHAAVFSEGGGHARLAIGASLLPAQMPVELELIFELLRADWIEEGWYGGEYTTRISDHVY